MELALLLARLVLAGVFIVAGVAKLADRRGSAEAMEGFGLPSRLAAPIGTLLPIAEIAVAIALVPTVTARWGALGALALLLAFVAGIGYNMARGKAPDCHCFGQLHSEPAGWRTLARNGALAALAAFVLWQGWDDAGASTVAWLGDISTIEGVLLGVAIIMLAAIAVEGWLLVQLMQQNGRLLLRLDALESDTPTSPSPVQAKPSPGLPVGTPAPTFELPNLQGEMVSLRDLTSAGKPTLLVFMNPGCKNCTEMLPEIARWQREHERLLTIALVSRGDVEANRAKTADHGFQHVLLQKELEVAKAYQLTGTPTAVLIRPDGTIGSPLGEKAEGIRELVARTVAAGSAPTRMQPIPNDIANGNGTGGVALGTPVPDARLVTLDGEEVALSSYTERGEATALVFWNPGCGFCQRMLDDLKATEANRPAEAPHLVVISTGDAERNRAQGLHSPMLLDQGFTTGRQFGARGTPSAVLIDAEGRVASPVAVGAPSVLALVTGSVPASTQN